MSATEFSSLDPANNYLSDSMAVGRLIYRTLTFIKDTPGENPSIQPDLAESLGTPSDDGRTWTYKLRSGLKYEDGRPITAQDIKYGVMRSFDRDAYPLGATWMPDLLANETGFESPYATPEKDLTSVETPDDRTLIFHFAGPQPDANWITSLSYTSPVPKDRDTKQDYGSRPVASGPYKIETYDPGKSLVLVRNENWSSATDPNRPAYPDRFQIELNVDRAAANQQLLSGDGERAFAVPLGYLLQVDNYSKLDDASVKPRVIDGPGPCVNYIAINTQKLKDPDVRHAIALAIDRRAIQATNGGDLSGPVVDSLIPPNIPGFTAPDLALSPGGDPDAAKKLLRGKAVPPLHLATAGDPDEANQIRDNLKAVGLEVIVDVHSDDDIDAVISADDAPEMTDYPAWCWDWPTAAAIVLPTLGPNTEGTSWASTNYAKYFDPRLSGELQALRSSSEEPAAVAKNFVEIANEIQTTGWPILPTVLNNDPEVVGANVTNVGISPIWGSADLNTLAVKAAQ
ncbi:ABC transporter substrate-binding protein [Mycobacterium sp. 2YAF39]|uniref:ABC transporter substrate-binding protein n=1 Tax=Mycobacterium sp. 2YAF39 TaxID=3233033 RepID=UPI003F948741